MSAKPSKAEYRAYANRWRVVNEYERVEMRRTSVSHKLEQLASLMASGGLFPPEDSEHDAETWARWKRLREAHRG